MSAVKINKRSFVVCLMSPIRHNRLTINNSLQRDLLASNLVFERLLLLVYHLGIINEQYLRNGEEENWTDTSRLCAEMSDA